MWRQGVLTRLILPRSHTRYESTITRPEPAADMTNQRDETPPPPDDASRTSVPPATAPPVSPKPSSAIRRSIPIPAAAPSDLWSGRLRVLGELGSGAMAEVLRGYDTKLRREVALKVTKHPRREMPRQQLARF